MSLTSLSGLTRSLNDLAKRDLVSARDMAKMTDAEIDAHVQKVVL